MREDSTATFHQTKPRRGRLSDDEILRIDTPEKALLFAVLERACIDWYRYLAVKKERPLNGKEKAKLKILFHWFFSDNSRPGKTGFNFLEVCSYLSDDPELLAEKIRKAALENPEKFKVLDVASHRVTSGVSVFW